MIEKFKSVFFDPRGLRQTVFKNFSWLVISNIGGKVLSAVVTIYAARALGVEGYGIFAYAFGLAGLFVFIKNVGVDTILTREVAQKPEERNEYLATAFWIEVGLLVFTVPLLLFVAPLLSKSIEAASLIPFIAIIFILDDLRDLFIAFFRGKEKMEQEAFVVLAYNAFLVVAGLTALYFWKTPQSLVIAYAMSSALGLISASAILRRHARMAFRSFRKNLVAPILKAVWPLAVIGFAGMFFLFNIDVVMLGWWRTPAEIGLYAAAQRIIGVLGVFFTLVGTSAFPALSRFVHQGDKEKSQILIENIFKIMFLVAVPIVAGGIILSNSLMGFVFGPDYVAAGSAFAVLILSILFSNAPGFISGVILAHNKQSKIIFYTIAAGVCNVVLNFLLIPKYGMVGCAIGTIVANLVYSGFLWRYARKFENFRVFPHLSKIIVSVFVMGAGVFLLQLSGVHVLVSIILGAAIYFASLRVLKEEALKEILILLHLSKSAS